MAKNKPVTSKAVEQEEFNPEPIEAASEEQVEVTSEEQVEVTSEEQVEVTSEEQVEVTSEEQQAAKKVAKKKGESSFGQMLAAANAKRKERKKLYGEG